MSITDELREWMDRTTVRFDDRGCLLGTAEELTVIADRIDEEYQKAIRELNNFADTSVLLPVDADGEVIHVGDMMERGKARGRVIALMLSNYPKKWGGALHWAIQLEGEQAPTALDAFFHHFHAPTVEDVLRDYASRILMAGCIDEEDELVDKYAAKLRLSEDGKERQ